MTLRKENNIIVIKQTKQQRIAATLSRRRKKKKMKPFDPKIYDRKVHSWRNKAFLKAQPKGFSFLNRALQKVHILQQSPMICQKSCHSRRPSWKSDVLFNVKDAAHGRASDYIVRFVYLRGKYISRVFEGEDSNISRWIQEMKNFVEKETGKIADASGKNFLVLYPDVARCEGGKRYTVLYYKLQ